MTSNLFTECVYVFHMTLTTVVISILSINWLVFVMQMQCVSYEVGTKFFTYYLHETHTANAPW
jgi:hypothetical protein